VGDACTEVEGTFPSGCLRCPYFDRMDLRQCFINDCPDECLTDEEDID
jgi:hypothetical protein